MTTIVGIFDAPERIEEATKRLATAEIDAVVLDEDILEQEPGSVDPALPTLAAGATAEVVAGREEPNLVPRRDRQRVMRAFRERLTQDFKLSEEESDAYATTLAHDGRFVLVRADDEDADQALQILKQAGATRVSRHD